MEPINFSDIISQEDNYGVNSTDCCICLQSLSNNTDTYTIPECNHTFHTNCIIPWFRTSNPNCPYCRSTMDNEPRGFFDPYTREGRYKMIRNIARKKNAPVHLKKMVNKLINFNKKLDEQRKKFTLWKKSEEGKKFKELSKKASKLRGVRKWINLRKIRELKSAIADYPIIPVPIKIN
jgi:hypothetical protein